MTAEHTVPITRDEAIEIRELFHHLKKLSLTSEKDWTVEIGGNKNGIRWIRKVEKIK